MFIELYIYSTIIFKCLKTNNMVSYSSNFFKFKKSMLFSNQHKLIIENNLKNRLSVEIVFSSVFFENYVDLVEKSCEVVSIHSLGDFV